MPRAHFIVLLLVILCLFCASPAVSRAAVWDETYETAKIFKAIQDINIRAQPSKNSKTMGVMKQGQTATVPSMVKGWYKVILPDGTTGFIYKRFMAEVAGAQPAPVVKPAQSSPAPKPEPQKNTPAPEPEKKPAEPQPAAAPEATPASAPEPATTPAPAPAPAPAATPVPAPEPAEQPEAKASQPEAVETQPMQEDEPVSEPDDQPVQPATPENKPAPEPAATIKVPAEPAHAASTGVDCIRIKFKNNALTGTAEMQIPKGGHDCYEVNLEKSQWMEVWLNSPEDAAMFEIFSPTGSTLCSREVHWLGRSGQAGEFIIFVSQEAGSGPYSLKVQVK